MQFYVKIINDILFFKLDKINLNKHRGLCHYICKGLHMDRDFIDMFKT